MHLGAVVYYIKSLEALQMAHITDKPYLMNENIQMFLSDLNKDLVQLFTK